MNQVQEAFQKEEVDKDLHIVAPPNKAEVCVCVCGGGGGGGGASHR